MSLDHLLILGLNHRTAPLELREKLAMNAERQRALCLALQSSETAAEVVSLCTCNRVELILASDRPIDADAVTESLAAANGLSAGTLTSQLYLHHARAAVAHLFEVASGLDSMVLGETQILGQLREAYQSSATAGATLHPLLQKAMSVGKAIVAGTSLSAGRMSVASVAVDYARQIFETLADKTVLTLGAGETIRLVLASFAALRPGRLLMANRDAAKAAALAEEFRGVASGLDELTPLLINADVIITSTAASEPILTRAMFEPLLRRRRFRPLFLIDLAVPRDIEPSVGTLENVYLYNLDDLQRVVTQTLGRRTEAVAEAKAEVEKHVGAYLAWHRQRALGPMIAKLYAQGQAIADAEFERAISALPELSPAQRDAMREALRRAVNKVLHGPVSKLRDAEPHAATNAYRHAMEKLFALGEDQ